MCSLWGHTAECHQAETRTRKSRRQQQRARTAMRLIAAIQKVGSERVLKDKEERDERREGEDSLDVKFMSM